MLALSTLNWTNEMGHVGLRQQYHSFSHYHLQRHCCSKWWPPSNLSGFILSGKTSLGLLTMLAPLTVPTLQTVLTKLTVVINAGGGLRLKITVATWRSVSTAVLLGQDGVTSSNQVMSSAVS